ncbi:hypothetical protein LY76DRAFT_102414 [Colletotrichum caudatum]|nr:hypothetical protein LY76DRAFT_102414 [Colletotrichum caudatum]
MISRAAHDWEPFAPQLRSLGVILHLTDGVLAKEGGQKATSTHRHPRRRSVTQKFRAFTSHSPSMRRKGGHRRPNEFKAATRMGRWSKATATSRRHIESKQARHSYTVEERCWNSGRNRGTLSRRFLVRSRRYTTVMIQPERNAV